MKVACSYCGQPAELVTGAPLYPGRPDLHEKKFWRCLPCGAYVGCHPHSSTPLGRLANAELRAAKRDAHRAFDPLWRDQRHSKNKRRLMRDEAYEWLAGMLKIPRADCHIGHFDLDLCRRTIEACLTRRKQCEPIQDEKTPRILAQEKPPVS